MKRADFIYSVIEVNGEEIAALFTSWDEFHRETFSPERRPVAVLTINHSHGNSYHERKANAHNLAVQYSNHIAPGLSMLELSIISSCFETLARRYGLVKEFRENAII